MNSETQLSYLIMFNRVFHLIAAHNREAIKFRHIHGTGIRVVRADMCPKQASGKLNP